MELGIEDEETKLYKQAEDVADNVLDNLDNQNKSTLSKTYNSKSDKYNFSMNVYCEKLNNEELDKIFNYINKRFGVEY
mgnify:CR=1 FL=1